MAVLGPLGGLESRDVREVPELLCKVQPVADHELVGDGEPHVVQGNGDLPPPHLVQEGADRRWGGSRLTVRPVSAMSSTMRTSWPGMERLRWWERRIAPEGSVPSP